MSLSHTLSSFIDDFHSIYRLVDLSLYSFIDDICTQHYRLVDDSFMSYSHIIKRGEQVIREFRLTKATDFDQENTPKMVTF